MANEHDLLPKTALEKEKSKDPKYDGLKMIKQNPRKVMLEDIETGEIKTFPSIYKAAKFIDQAPQTITLLGRWSVEEQIQDCYPIILLCLCKT